MLLEADLLYIEILNMETAQSITQNLKYFLHIIKLEKLELDRCS